MFHVPKIPVLVAIPALLMFLVSEWGFSQTHDSVRVAVPPAYLEKPKISFPEEALGASVTGKVWVKTMVGRDGKPIKTEILKREPEIAFMFDDVARRWAMQCRFSPAKDSLGNPVSVWIAVPLNFKIEDFQPPIVTRLVTPEYPEEALAMGLEGWVGIAILVSDLGNAANSKAVIVARDPPTTTVFDNAAKAAAKASEYQPALLSGRKTEGWCFVKIVFSLPGR